MHRSAPSAHFTRADDVIRSPVTALYEHVRLYCEDDIERCVLVEPRHQRDAVERRNDGSAVFEAVDRSVFAFTETLYRCIGIQRDDEAPAERARLGEVGHVAAMQDVEDAIGENEGPRKRRRASANIDRRADLVFESRCGVDRQFRYSNMRITRFTPLVVRATSVAASASARVTMPMR